MRAVAILTVAAAGVGGWAADPPAAPGFPKFQPQEIDARLGIGYGVVVADLNGDGKPDLAVADKAEVVWYENPGKDPGTAPWKKRVITAKTKGDHVALTAVDLDGDGRPELIVVGAWGPHGHPVPNPVYWLKAGKAADDEWAVHTIPNDEPSVHRVRAVDADGDNKVETLVLVPLMGRDATEKANWLDGRPVRIVAYPLPKDPTAAGVWKPAVISEDLHVVHGASWTGAGKLAAASYEGLTELSPAAAGRWAAVRVGEGNQATPRGSRGASEVGTGTILRNDPDGKTFLYDVYATVEPWHGNQVVVYPNASDGRKARDRHVVDERLSGGHGVVFADLDGDQVDELVVGVREDPDPKAGDTHTERYGVRVYKAADRTGTKWNRLLVDEGGVAVEDLTVADLDADGKLDIVAVGRYTRNVKIYWNKGR
ncbi:MAG: VCBS repeat-containing protein [Gemmataceae bacterium]|nr:VCBS repeat-containing protein [Gemmataceae bacterium]